MKTFIISFVIICSTLPGFAQTSIRPAVISVKVKVNHWGSRSIMLLNGFFKETKADIIRKIGKEEFDAMKDHCSETGWPSGIGYAADEDKLNQLIMYKVATYTHKYNGQEFQQYAILRVPYNENAGWDTTVKWEGNIYFLLQDKDVEAIAE